MIRNGQSAGPMHGLPVSIKENIPVRGCDSTVGVVKLLNNPNVRALLRIAEVVVVVIVEE